MAGPPRRAVRASLVADGLRSVIYAAVDRMTEAALTALLIPARLRAPDCG